MTTTTTDTPRIYVACLASYNAGVLHGRWLDVGAADELREEIQDMLTASPVPGAEEWAIHDYEGFGGLRLDEFESLERVAELGAAIREYGEAFAAYAGNVGLDYGTPEGFGEAFQGKWESQREFGEELAEELGYLAGLRARSHPNPLSYHIDWDSWARELFMGDYWSAPAPGGGVWVFSSV